MHLLLRSLASILVVLTLHLWGVGPLEPEPVQASSPLARILSRAKTSPENILPVQYDTQRAEQLFTQTLRREQPLDELQDAWSELDFVLSEVVLKEQRYRVLREATHRRAGRGVYAFRCCEEAMPIALQAPHSDSDRHTHEITLSMFADSPCLAAAWNSVHRSSLDAAHQPESFLNAFTRALLKSHPQALIVQLHGFAQRKRTTRAAANVDLIVSNGSRFPQFWVREAAFSLQRQFPHGITAMYPMDVEELGGTTNQQAQIVHTVGTGGFLHLEMSRSLRVMLRDDPDARSDLTRNVLDAYQRMADDRQPQEPPE